MPWKLPRHLTFGRWVATLQTARFWRLGCEEETQRPSPWACNLEGTEALNDFTHTPSDVCSEDPLMLWLSGNLNLFSAGGPEKAGCLQDMLLGWALKKQWEETSQRLSEKEEEGDPNRETSLANEVRRNQDPWRDGRKASLPHHSLSRPALFSLWHLSETDTYVCVCIVCLSRRHRALWEQSAHPCILTPTTARCACLTLVIK